MKLFQFVLCALIYRASFQAAVKERIFFGNEAREGQFPYQVQLMAKRLDNSLYNCGGSLISVKHVLTAQHCLKQHPYVKPAVAVAIAFGSNDSKKDRLRLVLDYGYSYHDIQVCNFADWILHKDYYRFGRIWADIAIINLPQPVQLSPTIYPIKLPSWSDRNRELARFTPFEAFVTGWGDTEYGKSHHTLLYASVRIVDKFTCKNYHVPETFICSPREHSIICNGDSGGPVVAFNKQLGIVSHAIPPTLSFPVPDGYRPCYDDVAAAYTSVSYFLDWIHKHTGIISHE